MNDMEIMKKTNEIINRAEQMGITTDKRINTFMDIELAAKTFDLDFDAWLNASDEDFAHDYIGIYHNVDRRAKNFGLFVPRFAKS